MWLNRLTTSFAPLFGLYWDFKLEIEGDDIPQDQALILAPNHASVLDPWFMIWLFPRPMHHLINRTWYERSWLWKMFFRANGTVPIVPNDPEATLDAVRSVLDRNQSFCIFPRRQIVCGRQAAPVPDGDRVVRRGYRCSGGPDRDRRRLRKSSETQEIPQTGNDHNTCRKTDAVPEPGPGSEPA